MERPVWDDEPKETRFSSLSFLGTRWFMVAVAGVAGVLGVAILYYLFTPSQTTGSTAAGEIPIVEAPTDPLKVKPETPGGWVAPHQDKEIYENLLAPQGAKEGTPSVLAPPAEIPLPVPLPPSAPQETGPQLAVEEVIEPVQVESLPTITAPAPLESLPGVQTPPPVKAEAPQSKAEVKPSKVKVQLASLGSKALAEKEVRTLKRKYGALLKGKSLVVNPAQVAGKGTVYRVHATGFSSADQGKTFCKKFADKGGKCFIAK